MSSTESEKTAAVPAPLTAGDIGRLLAGIIVTAGVILLVTRWLPAPLNGRYQTFLDLFLAVFLNALPFVLLGALVAAVIDVFVSRELLDHVLPRRPWALLSAGLLLGFALPVGEFGAVPVLRQLLRKGVPPALAVAFLLAAPVLNAATIAGTGLILGGGVLLWQLALTAAVALTAGAAAGGWRLAGNGSQTPSPAAFFLTRLWRAATRTGDIFFDFAPYLVIGCLLAAGAQSVLPVAFIFRQAHNPFLSALWFGLWGFMRGDPAINAAQSLANFVTLMPFGSVLAYLVVGSLLDVVSVVMLTAVLRKRVIVALGALLFALSAGSGLLLNLVAG